MVERSSSHDSMDVMVPPDMVTRADSEVDEAECVDERSLTGDRTDDGEKEQLDSRSLKETKAKEKPVTPAPAPPPLSQTRGVVREEGLDFNMDEPWQRSLLKQMQKKAEPPTKRGQRVMVGHTESRDFMMEISDDNMTLTTDASSTVPMRPQLIHRPWFYPEDSGTLALDYDDEDEEDDDDEEEEDAVSTCSSKPLAPRPQGAAKQAPLDVSPNSVYEERAAAAYSNVRASKHKDHWLEMEASDLDDHDDSQTVTTTAVTSNQNDACFCFGQNMLDLWMPPSNNNNRFRGRTRRLNTRHPGTTLARVQEGSNEEYGVVQQKLSIDPDGAYNDHRHYQQRVGRR